MRVYLDACCLSRLTDDQTQPRIRAEAEAIERVLSAVRQGVVTLISSEAIEDEVRRNPQRDRQLEATVILISRLSELRSPTPSPLGRFIW